MYTLFPSMFPITGFGYTQIHWVFGLDQGLQDGMRQLPSCGIELIETMCFSQGLHKVTILHQRVQRNETNMEKDHKQNQDVSQIVKFIAQSQKTSSLSTMTMVMES